jgi:hypothetical protein
VSIMRPWLREGEELVNTDHPRRQGRMGWLVLPDGSDAGVPDLSLRNGSHVALVRRWELRCKKDAIVSSAFRQGARVEERRGEPRARRQCFFFAEKAEPVSELFPFGSIRLERETVYAHL